MPGRRDALLPMVLAVLVTGCGGPFVVLPGGALQGPVTVAPADWSFLREVKTVQLETLPEEPYSVNLWAVGIGDRVYIHAGASRATWVANIEADPSVRLRADDVIYALTASRVEAQDEFDRFADAYEEKYGSRPRNEDTREAYLFRLEAP